MTTLLEEIEDLYNKFSEKAYEPQYLDRKTKELIAFSNSIVIDCKHCMKWHLKSAIAAGASMNEISEVVAIAMTVSAGKARGVAQDIIMGEIKNQK